MYICVYARAHTRTHICMYTCIYIYSMYIYILCIYTLQHHCNTGAPAPYIAFHNHTASHCKTPQHTRRPCKRGQAQSAPYRVCVVKHKVRHILTDSYTATHRNTLPHCTTAFNGCIEAAKTILKMHRANIQTQRFKRRDADTEQLAHVTVQLRHNQDDLLALRARIQELDQKELDLSRHVQNLKEQSAQEQARFAAERDRLHNNQKGAEETVETQAQQCQQLVCRPCPFPTFQMDCIVDGLDSRVCDHVVCRNKRWRTGSR